MRRPDPPSFKPKIPGFPRPVFPSRISYSHSRSRIFSHSHSRVSRRCFELTLALAFSHSHARALALSLSSFSSLFRADIDASSIDIRILLHFLSFECNSTTSLAFSFHNFEQVCLSLFFTHVFQFSSLSCQSRFQLFLVFSIISRCN